MKTPTRFPAALLQQRTLFSLTLALAVFVHTCCAQNNCANDDVLLNWYPTDYDVKYPYAVDFSNERYINNDYASASDCLSTIKVSKESEEVLPELTSLRDYLVSQRDDASGDTVLVLRNGANAGVVMDVGSGKGAEVGTKCLATMAFIAGKTFGVEQWQLLHPLRLFSASGTTIGSWEDVLRSDRIVHVLVEGESWTWPGVEVGFSWTVAGFRLQTVSLEPKVIVVHDFISEEEAKAVIDEGQKDLQRSPEKHYTDNPDDNYRTSETGTIDSRGLVAHAIRTRSQTIGRLSDLGMVEPLQLLRYTKGKWYKKHKDVFPDPKFELRTTDMDGSSYAQEFLGWCLFWRNALYASVLELQSILVRDVQPRPAHFVELQAAADAYFRPKKNVWYPIETNTRLQVLLYDLALAKGFVPQGFRLQRLSRFNQLLRDDPEVLDKLIVPYLCKLLFPDKEECGSGDVAYVAHSASQALPITPRSFRAEKNRIFTLLPYLSDVEEGGETVFPLAPGTGLYGRNSAHREGMDSCHQGIHVPPIKGSAALFYHLLPNATVDSLSLHGGCPPVKGIKYAMNIFCWNIDFPTGFSQFA